MCLKVAALHLRNLWCALGGCEIYSERGRLWWWGPETWDGLMSRWSLWCGSSCSSCTLKGWNMLESMILWKIKGSIVWNGDRSHTSRSKRCHFACLDLVRCWTVAASTHLLFPMLCGLRKWIQDNSRIMLVQSSPCWSKKVVCHPSGVRPIWRGSREQQSTWEAAHTIHCFNCCVCL